MTNVNVAQGRMNETKDVFTQCMMSRARFHLLITINSKCDASEKTSCVTACTAPDKYSVKRPEQRLIHTHKRGRCRQKARKR